MNVVTEVSKLSVTQKVVIGVTAIEFGEGGRITRIESDGSVNMHDLLQFVRDWNSNNWSHPRAVEIQAELNATVVN